MSIQGGVWQERLHSRPSAHVACLALLALLTLGNCLLSISWGLPDGVTPETTSTWAVDTIAPVGPLNEAYHLFSREGVDDVIYPLFHYVVLAGVYAPYVLFAMLTGGLHDPTASFPYGAADPTAFFSHLTVLAGLVSALMAAGIVLLSYLIARELFDRRAALWTAGFAALVPPLAYYGMTSNLDVPYLFWTMLALWQLVRAARHQRVVSYVLCGVFAALACATKDQAVGFFVAFPVIVVLLVAQDRRGAAGRLRLPQALLDRRVWGAGLAALLAFALGNNLLFGGWEGFLRHLQFGATLYEANVATDAPDLLARQPALLAHSVRLLLEMVGPAVLVLAAAGVWIALRERQRSALLLPLAAATYYVCIIAPTFALSRYLLGVVLLLLPFAGLAMSRAAQGASGLARRAAAVLAAVAVGWQLVLIAHLHMTLNADSRYAMEVWVRASVPPGASIEAYTQARYLPRLADRYRYAVVGNSFSAVSYGLRGQELSIAALERRAPDYIMVLADSGLSGDPGRITEASVRSYFDDLLAGRSGYHVIARFETPAWLPYRQITAGTQPTTLLLARTAAP